MNYTLEPMRPYFLNVRFCMDANICKDARQPYSVPWPRPFTRFEDRNIRDNADGFLCHLVIGRKFATITRLNNSREGWGNDGHNVAFKLVLDFTTQSALRPLLKSAINIDSDVPEFGLNKAAEATALTAYDYAKMTEAMAPLRRELLATVMHPTRLSHLDGLQLMC
jgi:hypothetical protein